MNPKPPFLKLVSAEPRHREFVRLLSTEAFARFGSYDKTLPTMMGWPWIRTVVAQARDRPIGFAMISLEDAGAGEIDLTAIAVEPAWQSRGVGRTLLRHVEQVARYAVAAGRTASVRLTVAEDNQRARGLFESVGYRLVPGEEDRYSGGQRSLLLRKNLKAGGEQSPDQDPNL